MVSLSNPNQETALRMLTGVLSELLDGGDLSATSREWLTIGLLRSLRRDEPLDALLGLRSQRGGRDCSPSIRLSRHVRDAWLCRAYDLIDPARVLPPGQRAVRLADAVKAFTRFDWPKTRSASAPPADWQGYRKALWFAAATDVKLPESANRLGVICRQAGCLQNDKGLKVAATYCSHISLPP